MSIACPDCAAQMPESAAFCPGCGRSMQASVRAQGTVGALPENVAGALAYAFFPAIVFLLVEPYNRNRFVRFHCFQCLFLCVVSLVAGAVLRLLGWILFIIPVLGHLLFYLISVLVTLAVLVIWLVLVVKALQGESFKLPVVGDFAEQQSGAV
jgi:uncharacterized membrane protein